PSDLNHMRLYQLAIGPVGTMPWWVRTNNGSSRISRMRLSWRLTACCETSSRLGRRRYGLQLIEGAEHPEMVQFELLDHGRPGKWWTDSEPAILHASGYSIG